MKPKSTLRRSLILAAVSSLLAVSSASAQSSGTWNVDANGLWGTDTNWLSNTIATGSGFTANFTNDIADDRTVSLDSDRTLTNVVFGDGDTATAGSWILNNNATATNNLILAGTTPTITVNALGTGKTATISAIIEGTAGLAKAGVGTLILSGVNTYSGTTTVDAGVLRWGVNNALGAGNLTVHSGGTVTLDTFTDTVGTITLNRGVINVATGFPSTGSLKTGSGGFITTGGTVNNWPGIGLGGSFAYNTDGGNETTASIAGIDFNGGSRTFTIADGVQAIDVDIIVSLFNPTNANLNFIKTGAGTMRISGLAGGSGTENYNLGTGTTTVQNGVLLLNKKFSGNNAVGGLGLVTVGDNSGVAGSAVLRYASTGVSDQILNNAITILSDGLFDLNDKSETTSGALTHSSGGSITTGVGTLTLGNATNTISGTSTVTGNLTFSGTAATNLTIGSTAIINGTTTFSGGAGGGITSTGTPQIQGTLALGTANRSLAVSSGTLNISAQITGSTGTMTKSGAGVLTLSNSTNSYGGAVTISAGTLRLGANNVIPNASNVAIGAATLDADTRTDTAGTLDVTGAATINLGVGATLAFADSKAVDWTGGTLNITGTLGATSLRFGDSADDLTSGPGGQLAKISVNGSGLGTYVLDANGYLVPGGGGPGPVNSFTISAISSPQTVGTPITGITITAKDASNATATGFTGTVTFGGTGGFTGTSASFTAGVLNGVSVTPAVAGSNLTLTVDDGAGHTGSTTISTIQTQYQFWAGGALFNQDANNDGVSNGLAFLLGAGGPNDNALGLLPEVTESGGDLVLNFDMLDAASRGTATLSIEHSSDLGIGDPWEATLVPDINNTINDVVFDISGSGPLGVQATIPASKTADGKLFGRLKANQP